MASNKIMQQNTYIYDHMPDIGMCGTLTFVVTNTATQLLLHCVNIYVAHTASTFIHIIVQGMHTSLLQSTFNV